MAEITIEELEQAIIKAERSGDKEALKTLIPYYESRKSVSTEGLTPSEVPGKYVNPELGAAAGAAGTAGVIGTTKAIPAAVDWLQAKQATANARALAPEITRQLFELNPPSLPSAKEASISGFGGQKWLGKLAGTGFAGGQMDAESLAKAKQLASIVNQGGEFAGGSITPSGIALPPNVAPTPPVPKEAPLSLMQRIYQGAGNIAGDVGRAVAPYAAKGLKYALPIAGGADIGYNLTDAYNRAAIGNWKDAILPSTAAGAGLTAMLSKNPRVAVPADGYTVLEPMIQDYWDKVKRGEIKHEAPDYSHSDPMGSQYATGGLVYLAEGGHATPAWQRKEGKNPEGGLNAKGRASYNRETGGNLKRPQPEGGKRRDSFCARMKGMKKKLTSAETANDPDSRINKSLRAWNC